MISRRDLLELLELRRRSRRQLVVAYWIVGLSLLSTTAILIRQRATVLETLSPYWFFLAVVWLPLLLQNIRSTLTRPLAVQSMLSQAKLVTTANPPIDERDLYVDTRAHYKAYFLVQVLVLPIILFLTLLETRAESGLRFLRVPLLWLAYLLVASLPKSLILWNEPDMEELP